MVTLHKSDSEFLEKCFEDQSLNLREIQRTREDVLFLLKENESEYLCNKYQVEAGQSIEDTFTAILQADSYYQRLVFITSKVRTFLASLTLEEQDFIELRYVKQRSWEVIADYFHMSISAVRGRWRDRLLSKALLHFID